MLTASPVQVHLQKAGDCGVHCKRISSVGLELYCMPVVTDQPGLIGAACIRFNTDRTQSWLIMGLCCDHVDWRLFVSATLRVVFVPAARQDLTDKVGRVSVAPLVGSIMAGRKLYDNQQNVNGFKRTSHLFNSKSLVLLL